MVTERQVRLARAALVLRRHLGAAVAVALLGGFALGLAQAWETVLRNADIHLGRYLVAYVGGPLLLTTLAAALLLGALAPLAAALDRRPRPRHALLGLYAGGLAACWLAARTVVATGPARALLVPAGLVFAALAGIVVARLVTQATAGRRSATWLGRALAAAAAIEIAFLPLLGWSLVRESRGLLAAAPSGAALRAGEQNVLLVTIDTLRADRVFGPRAAAPEVRRFAAGAAVFESAISQSPWTLPSVASLLTGQTPTRHGAGVSTGPHSMFDRSALPEDRQTLAAVLAAAGYTTQAIVTNPHLFVGSGLARGFEGYENLTLAAETFNVFRDTLAGALLAPLVPRPLTSDGAETVTDRALAWLDRHGERKFALWVHYIDPHAPYGQPGQHRNKNFRAELRRFAGREGAAADGVVGDFFDDMASVRSGELRLGDADRQRIMDLYDTGVAYADAHVGRLLRALERRGLLDRTVVVVTADHGEELWEHGWVEHGRMVYDEVVRVPLVVRDPAGAGAGRRIGQVVRLIDVAPTILDLAGLDPGRLVDAEGESLVPLLQGGAGPPRLAVSENLIAGEERVALRGDRHTYIRWANGKEELYDVVADPAERVDLAGDPSLVLAHRERYASVRGAGGVAAAVVHALPPGMDAARRRALGALGYVR